MREHASATRIAIAGWDCLSWLMATAFVVVVRFELILTPEQVTSVILYGFGACALQLGLGTALKLYRGRFRIGSYEEILAITATAALVGVMVGPLVVVLRGQELFPHSVAFIAPPMALISIAAGRGAYRAWTTRTRPWEQGVQNVLIYGAGDLGYQLVRLMATDRSTPFRAVGFIDDDRGKRNLRMAGVPVRGTRADLLAVARAHDVTTVILGIGNAGPDLIREVEALVTGAGLEFKVLPHLSRIIGSRVTLRDVRDVEIGDVLGRRQVVTDVASIADYLTGHRVLMTGAGGSIGSELARQVHTFGPSELILLDRDESALHEAQLAIYGRGLLDTPDIVLADIRDVEALRSVFARHRPEVVFHAAALKHLPMLEQYPEEGWKTNVLGTRNLLELAARHGVRQFVNISTDKAVSPTNVLGSTKRLAERLTAWQALHADGKYLSVRFGNVIGSRGSVLRTFLHQIERGGPVTITHPGVTRYFMTIPEACELVIQAAAIGRDGEVLVLDMGEPVRVLDVAERLIARSGKDVEVVFTGLRPGEKMHEELFGPGEEDRRPFHPLIAHVEVPPLDPRELAPMNAGRQGAGDGSPLESVGR